VPEGYSHHGSATVYPGWVSLGAGGAQAAATAGGDQTTENAATIRIATPSRSDLIERLHQKINLSCWMYHVLTIAGRPSFTSCQIPRARGVFVVF
jgi:hypothetical protein